MKELLAITILGLDKQEQSLVSLFLDLIENSRYGEIPGKNIRLILDLTKEQLFNLLEGLAQKRIVKYLLEPVQNTVYIRSGNDVGSYVFNKNYKEWIPNSDSLFYKLCKLLNLRYNDFSYQYILNEFDIRSNLVEGVKEKVQGVTPYELYGEFVKHYKRYFNRDYKPLNQAKDFGTLKRVISDLSYNNYSDKSIRDFIPWCFLSKVKSFKGGFIIGFLPLCLKDYTSQVTMERLQPGITKNEDGRLVKNG